MDSLKVPLNQALVGKADALAQLQTPLLAVDRAAMDRNIAKMAAMANDQSILLRPHAKTHKCVALARRQIEAGAVGVCAATLGEAEPFISAGLSEVLITSPAIGPGKPERLLALRQQSDSVKTVIDSPATVKAIAGVMSAAGLVQQVLVGLDIGAHRIGARTVEDAVAIAAAIDASQSLKLVGVFAYAGNLQHIVSYPEREKAVVEANQKLNALVTALESSGHQNLIVSGGGTGSADIDLNARSYTEIQVGSYVFMDVEYGEVQLGPDAAAVFEQSLWVLTRVISANHPGFVTTDAGTKRFSMGGPEPEPRRGAPAGSRYDFLGDEHGKLILPDGVDAPPLETLVWVRPGHCDPTVNLYDELHVLEGDQLVDIWPIEGRGAV